MSPYDIGVGRAFGRYHSWAGGIDEIALYDRPLDDATISAHALDGDAFIPCSPAVGLYGVADGDHELRCSPRAARASRRPRRRSCASASTRSSPGTVLAIRVSPARDRRTPAVGRTGTVHGTIRPAAQPCVVSHVVMAW